MCAPVTAQSWLQRGKVKHTTRPHADGVDCPPPKAGRVDWDGSRSFDVEREEVAAGFAAEVHYKLAADQLGTMNSSHVFVPFGGELKTAVFVRALHGLHSFEYGYAKLTWQATPATSMWGETFVVGALEKLHTLEHTGAWSDESLRMAQEAQSRRRDSDEMIAQVSRTTLHTAVSTWAVLNQGREKLANASLDPHIFQGLGSDAVVSSGAFDARMAALDARLKHMHATYVQGLDGAPPANSHASIDNFHLTAAPGLQVTAEGFWWPLGRKIRSIRGQIAFEPLERFDMMAGNTVIQFNEEDQAFDIFTGAATHSNIPDPGAGAHGAKFFVGPLDGENHRISNEGRFPSPSMQPGIARIVREFRRASAVIPPDYRFLFEPPEDLCPPDVLAKMESLISGMDFLLIAAGEAAKADTFRAAGVMALVVDCAADFLRGDADVSHSFGQFEAMELVHTLAEFGRAALLRGWNEVPAYLFSPP